MPWPAHVPTAAAVVRVGASIIMHCLGGTNSAMPCLRLQLVHHWDNRDNNMATTVRACNLRLKSHLG